MTDLFAHSHDYLLSLDMATKLLAGKDAKAEPPKDGRPGSLGYGPIRHRPDRAAPPDLDRMIERRYRPLWSRLGGLR